MRRKLPKKAAKFLGLWQIFVASFMLCTTIYIGYLFIKYEIFNIFSVVFILFFSSITIFIFWSAYKILKKGLENDKENTP